MYLLAAALCAGGLLEFLTGSVAQVAGSDSASIQPAATAPHGARTAARVAPRRHGGRRDLNTESLLFAIAHRTVDASRAGELFAPKSWYSPPPPPPPPAPVPLAAPTAPPLPYTFVGSYTDGNGTTVYFVTREDRVYDVKPGDVLDQIYSVGAVENGQLVFTYKPLNVRQLLPIGAAP